MNAAAKVAVRIEPQGSANLNLFIVTFWVGMRSGPRSGAKGGGPNRLLTNKFMSYFLR
jgi:hypothetical protein